MIRMLTTTYFNGKNYEKGETYSVDETIIKRWIQNGIAEPITDNLFNEQSKPKQSKFETMSDEQLAEYAELKGIDVSRCRSRKSAIAKIEEAE